MHERGPVESGAGILLAWPGDVFVTCDVLDRVACCNRTAEADQGLVLRNLKDPPLNAFKFYADGIVVAIFPASVVRDTCMPGA